MNDYIYMKSDPGEALSRGFVSVMTHLQPAAPTCVSPTLFFFIVHLRNSLHPKTEQ